MLEGKDESTAPFLLDLLRELVILAFCIPFYLFAGILILAGAVALGKPELPGGLAFSLPAGLLLTALITWFLLNAVWLKPRRTIGAFTFDGSLVSFQTPTGWHQQHAVNVCRICEGRLRGRGQVSWWLYFRDGSWAVLPIRIRNSSELVSRLRDPINGALDSSAHPVTDCAAATHCCAYDKDKGLSFGPPPPSTTARRGS